MKVCILSDYEEHGAENVAATLDPSRLPAMVDAYYISCMANMVAVPNQQTKDAYEKIRLEARELLGRILAEEPAAEGMWRLQRGWGGLQLHIVELT